MNNLSKTDKIFASPNKVIQLVDYIQDMIKKEWKLMHAETTDSNKRRQLLVGVGRELYQVGYHDFNEAVEGFIKVYEGENLTKACELYLKVK